MKRKNNDHFLTPTRQDQSNNKVVNSLAIQIEKLFYDIVFLPTQLKHNLLSFSLLCIFCQLQFTPTKKLVFSFKSLVIQYFAYPMERTLLQECLKKLPFIFSSSLYLYNWTDTRLYHDHPLFRIVDFFFRFQFTVVQSCTQQVVHDNIFFSFFCLVP